LFYIYLDIRFSLAGFIIESVVFLIWFIVFQVTYHMGSDNYKLFSVIKIL
jgi:hypothetical protein